MFPTIPFASLPRKTYKKGPMTAGGEMKPRLDLKKLFDENEVTDDYTNFLYESSSDDDVIVRKGESDDDSGSEYDLLEHLAELLPGELDNGKKPPKEANTQHLQELRPIKKKIDHLRFIKDPINYILSWPTRERERRKHYIFKEYEQQLIKLDEIQAKIRLQEREVQEQLIRKEAIERRKRIERNSRKVN
jgi:hypothetical protein